MPLRLALLAPKKANKYINNYEKINNSVIMGHSLDGAMAATFSENHPEKLEILIMLVTYPANSVDLSDNDIDVLSIYASEDNIADKNKILAAKEQLPESTEFFEIKGGNHSYFGSYGFQKGGGKATITEDEQINMVVNHIVSFLNKK
jgi:alpha/beta superfamily hydrolase